MPFLILGLGREVCVLWPLCSPSQFHYCPNHAHLLRESDGWSSDSRKWFISRHEEIWNWRRRILVRWDHTSLYRCIHLGETQYRDNTYLDSIRVFNPVQLLHVMFPSLKISYLSLDRNLRQHHWLYTSNSLPRNLGHWRKIISRRIRSIHLVRTNSEMSYTYWRTESWSMGCWS